MAGRFSRIRGRWKALLGGALGLALLLFLNNTSMFSSRAAGRPTVLAHRGMSQRYTIPDRLDNCAAAKMLPAAHAYLENTIPSIQAAFDSGADVVEFDVHATRDGQFAVFHDRFLECRTNGSGITREHTMAELQALDIGHGYTADNGRTYPFRGKAIGLMPSMDQVFSTFPDRSFLIDVKGGESKDGPLLAAHLLKLPAEQRSRLMIFARDAVLEAARGLLPDVRMFSASATTRCLLQYIGLGWSGWIPSGCHNAPVWVPINVAPWLWGWPNRFMNRFENKGGFVILMGDYPANEISPGLDTSADLMRIPAGYNGGIWTNDVVLASSYKRSDPYSFASPPSGP